MFLVPKLKQKHHTIFIRAVSDLGLKHFFRCVHTCNSVIQIQIQHQQIMSLNTEAIAVVNHFAQKYTRNSSYIYLNCTVNRMHTGHHFILLVWTCFMSFVEFFSYFHAYFPPNQYKYCFFQCFSRPNLIRNSIRIYFYSSTSRSEHLM